MAKQSMKFMMAVALLVVSGSFAKADTYSITSDWAYGGNPAIATFTGNGTFDWDGTTVTAPTFVIPTGFTNISFSFTVTGGAYASSFNGWTASSTDGAYVTNTGILDIGNGTFDCNGGSCISLVLSGPLVTGGPLTLTGISNGSSTQDPNSVLIDATVTDITHAQGALPEPSAIALLGTISGILGFVIFRRRKLVQ
jgi:hypothetical protein